MAFITVSVIVLIGFNLPLNLVAQDVHDPYTNFTSDIPVPFHNRNSRQLVTECHIPSQLHNGLYQSHERRCPPSDTQPSAACRLQPGVVVPPGWVLRYTCGLGYRLSTTRLASICLQRSSGSRWLPPLPTCLVSLYNSLSRYKNHCGTPSSYPRMAKKVDGTLVKRGAHPWMVMFGHPKSADPQDGVHWFCAGVLVTTRYVLTAANCVALHRRRPPFFARLDDLNLEDSGEDGAEPISIGVERSIIHPEYHERKVYAHNIAIVQLKTDIIISDYIRPICLPTPDFLDRSFTGKPVHLIGWGQTDNDRELNKNYKRNFEPVLQELRATVMDHEECSLNYTRLQLGDTPIIVSDHHLCARVDVNKSCQGDVGSPLMLNHKGRYILLGITIPIARNNRGCYDEEEFPRIFTKISYYMNWIVHNLNVLN